MSSYIPVLTYHSIDSSGSVISLSLDQFQRHMAFLAESGFSVLSLGTVLKRLHNQEGFPDKSVVITFDDGFKNFFAAALPVLMRYRFPATVFLVTGMCGKDNYWAGQLPSIPRLEMLEWKEVEAAAHQGIEFGAHTVSHPNLSLLPKEQYVEEILDSKAMIQDRLGQEVDFFAYPYGILNPEIHGVIRENFKGACSVEMDVVTLRNDPCLLPRVDMYYFSQNEWHRFLGKPPFYWYVKTRKYLRTVKSLYS